MSQDPKRKLTPEEILDAIEEADAADEAERILALSDEELDRELKAEGFDPEEVRAEGRAIAERARVTAEHKAADVHRQPAPQEPPGNPQAPAPEDGAARTPDWKPKRP